MNKLIFYNNNNNGDIHFSREFIKDIMSKTSFDEYYHSHMRSPKLTMDIKNLKYAKLNTYCKPCSFYHVVNNETYINTHLGGMHDLTTDSLLNVDLDTFYNYFQIIYSKLKISMEKKKFYIPEINYEVFEIQNVKEYIKSNLAVTKVLVSNGSVYSNQSMHVDFKVLIEKLAIDYPEMHFILTDKSILIDLPNVFYTDDIIQAGLDLNEISYLSTKCSAIIGRASGPYSFTEVKVNLDDVDKMFIFICGTFSDGIWCEQTRCSKVWINDYSFDNIYTTIHTQLKTINNLKNMIQVTGADNLIYITSVYNFQYEMRVEFYNGMELWFNYNSVFSAGVKHWIKPHGNYVNGYPVRCRFYNNQTNEYLFETMV